MKKRTLTISLIVLAIMLLVGIGYAGWVIASSTSGSADGNFTAYGVEDASLTVSTPTPQSVIYGKPADLSGYHWLAAEGTMSEERLTVTFTISWSQAVTNQNISFTITPELYLTAAAATAGTQVSGDDATNLAKLIAGPTIDITAGTGYSYNPETHTLTLSNGYAANTAITVTATYAWGAAFGSSNPFTFFNAKTATATIEAPAVAYTTANPSYQVLANEALTALNTYVTGGLNFKIRVAKVA